MTPEAARDMARELGMSVQQSMQCSLFRTLTHQSPSMHTTSVFVNSSSTGAVGYYECSALTQSGLTEVMRSAVRASLYPSGNSSNRKWFTWFRRKRYSLKINNDKNKNKN